MGLCDPRVDLHDLVSGLDKAFGLGLGVATPRDDPEPAITVELNTDFSAQRLSAQDMGQLMSALGVGYIDFSTWFYNLQKGEIIPPGLTMEQMAANILAGTLGQVVSQEVASMLVRRWSRRVRSHPVRLTGSRCPAGLNRPGRLRGLRGTVR